MSEPSWLVGEFSALLGVPNDDASQIVAYLRKMGTAEEASNYIKELLGDTPESNTIISKYIQSTFTPPKLPPRNNVNSNDTNKQKSRPAQTPRKEIRILPSSTPKQSPNPGIQKPRRKTEPVNPSQAVSEQRRLCECLATKHELLTNCLSCGKIICSLEGPGPCTFCGSLVESKSQQIRLIQQKRKQKTGPGYSTYGQKAGAGMGVVDPLQFPTLELEKAERQKERLLEYDRNSTARTKVYDTASDYDYHSLIDNKWLTPQQRALALKQLQEQRRKEEEDRRRRVITIDLQTNRVVEVAPQTTRKRVALPKESKEESTLIGDHGSTGLLINPRIQKTVYFVPEVANTLAADNVALTMAQKKKIKETERNKPAPQIKVENTDEGRKRPTKRRLNRLQRDFNDIFEDYSVIDRDLESDSIVPCG